MPTFILKTGMLFLIVLVLAILLSFLGLGAGTSLVLVGVAGAALAVWSGADPLSLPLKLGSALRGSGFPSNSSPSFKFS